MPGTTKSIGFYGVATQEVSNRILTGVLRYCQSLGGLVVRDFRIPPGLDKPTTGPPPFRGRADGVITVAGRENNMTAKETADWYITGGCPVVSASSDWIDRRIPCLRVQCRSLGELAANHLEACGCRAFLFVGFTYSDAGSKARQQALAGALKRRRKTLASVLITKGMFGWPSDFELILKERQLIRLLKQLPKPLGVWTLNDQFARAICRLCAHLNFHVPTDVKVLGVDDLFTSRAELPALSTIHTPVEQVGYQAMATLHRLLQGHRVEPLTEVPADELVPRESTVGGMRASDELHETVEYLTRHACGGLTVEHLAQRLQISRRSFEMKFHAYVGRSPGAEIQRVRLERAKELLWNTQLSMKQISSLVGYQETACFSKFFRKETGLSPREYRASAAVQTPAPR